MDEKEASHLLADTTVVPCVRATVIDAKRLRERFLDHDIPAVLGRDASCATGGCAPTVQVLVREEDIPRVAQLMQEQWLAAAMREGSFNPAALTQNAPAAEGESEADPPCPACGTAQPLVEGACSECGLQLE